MQTNFKNSILSKLLLYFATTCIAASNLCAARPVKTSKADDVVLIKGTVLDEAAEPLPGASIIQKGTKHGTSTDVNGNFSFSIKPSSKGKTILIVSFIGMKSEEIEWKGEKTLSIMLNYSNLGIDGVVMTGFREIDKRKLSSSITSVKLDDIKLASATSLDQMLQGNVAGISVLNHTATPGLAPKIRIRGSSSITGNREPVWVVDGIVLDEPVSVSVEELNNIDNVNFVGNAISGLNPSDIERIDILKDVSATALYGTKAANGVIVVTTKRGKEGRTSVNYNGTFSLTAAPNYGQLNLMNSKERIEMSEEIADKGLEFKGYAPTGLAYEGALEKLWKKEYTPEQFSARVKELKEINTDWMKLLFHNAPTMQHNLSISGGTKKMDYYISLGRMDQKDVHKYGGVERTTAMLKINTSITDNLKAGLKLNTGLNKSKYPHSSISVLDYVYRTSRAISPFDANGKLQYYPNSTARFGVIPFNIFNELETTGKDIENQNMAANLFIDWKILPYLRFNSIGGVGGNITTEEDWADARSSYISSKRGLPYGAEVPETSEYAEFSLIPVGGELRTKNTRNIRYTFRNSLEFNKTFNSAHNVYAVLGSELVSSQYKSYSRMDYGYMPFRGKTFAEIDTKLYIGYANLVARTSPKIEDNLYNTVSLYGAFTYTYKDRYIANFNIRSDGSNRFGQDKSVRFLPVWSISGRWNAHEENWLRNVSWINELAVRASYGIQGNVHPSQTPYLILKHGNYNSSLNEFLSTLSQFPNNNLKWEKTVSYNLGFDWAFLDGRISGSLELYNKMGYDQIITRRIKPSNGANSVVMNAGDISNKGWELTLNFVPVRTKDWTWSLSFNSGKNYNKVINQGDVEPEWRDYINGTVIRNGMPVNAFYSYRFKGLDPNTGLPTFYGEQDKDEHGEPLYKSKEEAFANAFVYSGKREPDLSGGFSSSLKWKNFTLNALFSFSFGGKTRLNDLYLPSGQGLPYPQQNMSKEFVNRWRKPGDEAHTNIPALSDDKLAFGPYERKYPIAENRWDMYNKSDIRVVSSSFLRCRSLSLRYDFDRKLINKIKFIKGGSLAFEMGNLFVIKDKRLVGQDPEQLPLYSGTIPPQRTFSLRVNLTF